jgi:hypothetical protein
VQLGLLAAANLLAAVGGGRVTSAAKGVTGLTMLGSAAGLVLAATAYKSLWRAFITMRSYAQSAHLALALWRARQGRSPLLLLLEPAGLPS